MLSRSLALILLFSIVVGHSLTCPNEQSIKESLDKVHIPGAAIIVVNATHTLYERAFGYQSLSPLQPMDTDKSIFPLASISKTFIAAAVMQLVERELVDLDTDINQYLSEPHRRIYHPNYTSHSITLRKLLSHSASIAVSPELTDTYYRPGDTALEESLADFCYKYVNPNTSYWLPRPPGRVASYSNEGSALAALVVERVANMSYIQYVRERIMQPLGVDISKIGVYIAGFADQETLVNHYTYADNTSYLPGWQQAIPQLNTTAISAELPTWLRFPHFSFGPYPAGLLRMSARALSVYLRMFLNNGAPILQPRSIAEIKTIVGGGLTPLYDQQTNSNATAGSATAQFGLSWYWNNMSDGRRYIGHSGSMLGMVHLMLVNEKSSIGVIVLTNGDVSAPTDLSKEIAKAGQDIHMALFQCFDPKNLNASACGVQGTRVGLFLAAFLFSMRKFITL